MSKRLFKTMVAVLAIAAAAAGPAWGQTTYNVTFGGFAQPEMNTTVSVTSLPQTFTRIGVHVFYPFTVLSNGGDFSSASVTSGGNGKVSVDVAWNQMAIIVSGTFEGTATIHVEGHDNNEIPVSCDITVACAVPPVPITVRLAAGTEEAANWTLASGNASVSGTQVLENVMSGSEVTATYNGTRKVKSVKAVKYVAPVPVQSIVLDKQTASLAKDSTMTLTASVLPENAADKSYSWSSDATGVATVNENGVVTGVASGTANIIATANDGSGAADTCVVTVIALQSLTLDGVTVLYASNDDNWSTVMGYNPGLMYQDGHNNVRLTSNGAFLFFDGHPMDVTDLIHPLLNEYQWMRVVDIHGMEFYYHQGETWQQAISANRLYNNHWSINDGKVILNGDFMLVDTNNEPVDPTATIDPSTVDYDLFIMDN